MANTEEITTVRATDRPGRRFTRARFLALLAVLGPGLLAGLADDDPAGITTQDPELFKRFDPILGGRRLKNYLKVMTLEAQTIARACGKNHLHNLEPEDLCALTIESAAMAGVPLAGTNWIPGRNGGF